MTQNLGSTSNPLSMTGEQWVLEERTDDPLSPDPGECWIRSDLNAGDKIATLKFGDGSEVPIFPTGTSETGVLEVRRVQTGGQTGYLPVAEPDESRFPQFRLQHNNTEYSLHDDIEPGVIADGVLYDEGELEDDWSEAYVDSGASVSKESDHLEIIVGNPDDTEEAGWGLNEMVDLSSYSILEVEWEAVSENGGSSYILVDDSGNESHQWYTEQWSKYGEFTRTTDQYDISTVSSEQQVRVHARDGNSSDVRDVDLSVYVVRLIE